MSASIPTALDLFLEKPGSISLDTNTKRFHTYTIRAVDTKDGKPARKYASQAIEAAVADVAFPPNAMPHGNHHLRVTDKIVTGPKNSTNRNVKDVFFVVKMSNAKTSKATSTKGYREVSSGSTKGHTKDNRQWIAFSMPVAVELNSDASLKEKLELAYQNSAKQPNVEQEIAVDFDHFETDLGDLSGLVARYSSKDPKYSSMQQSIDHHTGQLIDREIQGHSPPFHTIIRGNRVFVKTISSEHGLDELRGLQGRVVYDGTGNPVIKLESCSAHFFQPILVSDFLEKYFGITLANINGKPTLSVMSNTLRGTQVLLASRKGEPIKVATIAGLVHRSDDTEAVSKIFHKLGITSAALDLKHPNMPFVNVGTIEHPDCRPAEHCKIVGGAGKEQMFIGSVPYGLGEDYFTLQLPTKKVEDFTQKTGDLFPKAKAEGFKLFFVNLTTEEDGKSPKAVREDVMASIKEEIGSRYGHTLGEAVKTSADLEATPRTLGGALAFSSGFAPGIKSVLVVVVPEKFSSKEIDRIRTECDVRYGVQCCIVDGRDATRKYHPIDNVGMVKLSGGFVRQMFGKALIPALPAYSITPASTSITQIVGVNVHKLERECYLIDIISVAKNGGKATTVRVTNHVFASCDCDDLATELMACLKQHSPVVDTANIFVAGYMRGDEEAVEKLGHLLEADLTNAFPSIASRFCSLISVAPEHRLLLDAKNQHVAYHEAPIQGVERMDDRFVSQAKAFADDFVHGLYNIPPQVGVGRSFYPSARMVYRHFKTTAEGPKHSRASALSSSTTLTILYLAHEASKRSRLHVFDMPNQKKAHQARVEKEKKAAGEQAKGKKKNPEAKQIPAVKKEKVECSFGITPVHPELKNTFYFL